MTRWALHAPRTPLDKARATGAGVASFAGGAAGLPSPAAGVAFSLAFPSLPSPRPDPDPDPDPDPPRVRGAGTLEGFASSQVSQSSPPLLAPLVAAGPGGLDNRLLPLLEPLLEWWWPPLPPWKLPPPYPP